MEPTPKTIARAAAGDDLARREVVEALQQPIYRLAVRMVLSRHDAEDAAQEALIRILEGLPTFRSESKLTTWAYRVAAHAILDFKRGQYRRPLLAFDAFRADLEQGLDIGAEEQPEDRVFLGQVLLGCTRALLQCLDGDHRLAYVVGEIMQFSGPDGAGICDVTEVVFRKRLSRARNLIRTALADQCGVINPDASCQCHRRLSRARQLGRVGSHVPDPGLDVADLRRTLHQISDLAERAATLHAAEPHDIVPPDLARRIREMAASTT